VTVTCPKCRSNNADEARFCSRCSASFPSPGKNGEHPTLTIPPPRQAPVFEGLFAERYEIIKELGRGGMGIVYKANDTKLDRIVALKFLPPEWSVDVPAKERFIREARAAAALDHPSICAVHEIDEAEGRMYISMAFVGGESLQRKIERGFLTLEEAVDIGAQAAAGLKEAHLKGVVHRDIKSANIMISDEGRAKILDFGLAKVRGGVLVTKEGATMGTVAYMSPEQARAEAVDHRTDIWSLGVVLYQALTGELPFPGEHDQVVLHSILHQEPKPPRKQRAGIPAALEQIVGRALEKKREARYHSADEMLADLLRVKKDLEAGSSEEGLSWPWILVKRRVPQILGLYVLASLGILQLVQWLVNRFILSPHLPDFSLAALLSFVPTVLLLASFHGRPGRRKWALAEKIGIAANLAASAALLVFLFSGKSLGAATTKVTLKTEEGRTVERVIPKGEFLKSFAIFFFENRTNDPALDWLQYAFPRLLELDLDQDLFTLTAIAYDFVDAIKAAGFENRTDLPLTLKNKLSRDRHLKYFVSGSFSKEGEEFVLETSLVETKRATEVAKREFRGRNIFALTDRISLEIKHDLGIPEQHLKDLKDLPISEMVTASVPALKSYTEGINALVFEQNWNKSLEYFERSAAEDPTFVYAFFEIQRLSLMTNQPEKREQAFQTLMRHLYKLPERHQYFVKSSFYAFKEDKDKQIAVLKMMVELSPEDIAGHGELANLYSSTNQRRAALAEFKRILDIDPGQKDVLLAIGSLHKDQGEFDEARGYYERYAAQFPEDVKSPALLGDLYRAMGDFERAKSAFEKALLIEPQKSALLVAMANIESALGNFETSEKICQEALKNAKTPQERIQVYESWSSVLETQGRFRRSLEVIRLLLDELNKSRPPFYALLSQSTYTDTFIKAGRKDEAFKIVENIKSQAAPPFDTLVPLIALSIHISLEDVEKASNAIEEVESTPLSPLFENNRPSILEAQGRVREMKGEYKQAIAAYEKTLELRPASMVIGIGRCHRKLREFKNAEEYFQKWLKTAPFDPRLHNELSLVYSDMGDKKKASEHLDIALNVWKNADPGIPEIEEARARRRNPHP